MKILSLFILAAGFGLNAFAVREPILWDRTAEISGVIATVIACGGKKITDEVVCQDAFRTLLTVSTLEQAQKIYESGKLNTEAIQDLSGGCITN